MGKRKKAKKKRAQSFINVIEFKKLTNGEVALTISAKACLPHEKIMRSLAYDGCGLVSAREVDAGGGDEHQFLHQGSVVSTRDHYHYHMVFKSEQDARTFLQSLETMQHHGDLRRDAAAMRNTLSWNAGSFFAMQGDDADCAKIDRFAPFPEAWPKDLPRPMSNDLLGFQQTTEMMACAQSAAFWISVSFVASVVLILLYYTRLFSGGANEAQQAHRTEQGRRRPGSR